MTTSECLDELAGEIRPDCFCGHDEDRHGRNAAGPHRGACLAALCGCMWYRPDPQSERKTA